jgi:hypothetical protein
VGEISPRCSFGQVVINTMLQPKNTVYNVNRAIRNRTKNDIDLNKTNVPLIILLRQFMVIAGKYPKVK